MSALTGTLSSDVVRGNGLVLAVIARFKSLRMVPNILIVNFPLVDLLNAAINMPLYLISSVWETSWFKGKTLAVMTTFLNRLFIVLNLTSMLALMANMYFAINFDLKHSSWKSSEKAALCSRLIWLVGTVTVVLLSIPLLCIDLGDTHIIEYRAEIYNQGKYFVAAVMAFLIVCGGVIGVLTTRSIKKKKKKVFQSTRFKSEYTFVPRCFPIILS